MHWKNLNRLSQVEELLHAEHPSLLFKHSTRCSVSAAVLNRLERNWDKKEMQGITPYFLDLLTYRNISDKIAETFAVQHESPQVLIIRNGKAVYHASHFDIQYEQLKQVIKS